MAGGARSRPYQVAPAPLEGEAKADDDPADSERVGRVEQEEEKAHTDQHTGSDEIPAEIISPTRVYQNVRASSMMTESSGIEMQFPMFVMPIHKFLGLTELLPHQELRRMEMLVERDASMETVIFVSHQWTSFVHPDHTGRQLHALQRMFERMLTGEVPEVDAPIVDRLAFKDKVKVAPREWKSMLRNTYIWVDFAGVPQEDPTTANDAASGSDGRYVRHNEHKGESYTSTHQQAGRSIAPLHLTLHRALRQVHCDVWRPDQSSQLNSSVHRARDAFLRRVAKCRPSRTPRRCVRIRVMASTWLVPRRADRACAFTPQ